MPAQGQGAGAAVAKKKKQQAKPKPKAVKPKPVPKKVTQALAAYNRQRQGQGGGKAVGRGPRSSSAVITKKGTFKEKNPPKPAKRPRPPGAPKPTAQKPRQPYAPGAPEPIERRPDRGGLPRKPAGAPGAAPARRPSKPYPAGAPAPSMETLLSAAARNARKMGPIGVGAGRIGPVRMSPGQKKQIEHELATLKPIWSREQFKKLYPYGRYGEYIDVISEQRGVDAEILILWAPEKTERKFQKVVKARARRLERFIAGAKVYGVDISWVEGQLPPNLTVGMKRMIQLAKQYLGTPYSWGGGGIGGPSRGTQQGAGTVGFDCSGFIQYLYASTYGIDVGDYTGTQVKAGRSVLGQRLQPGDAVFWGGEPPSHVGLYIGNGMFIHAPQTGDVIRISSLDERGAPSEVRRYV